MNLNILEATPRYAIHGVTPWSYTIIFHDWQAMTWWDDGTIQNALHPLCSEPERKEQVQCTETP